MVFVIKMLSDNIYGSKVIVADKLSETIPNFLLADTNYSQFQNSNVGGKKFVFWLQILEKAAFKSYVVENRMEELIILEHVWHVLSPILGPFTCTLI